MEITAEEMKKTIRDFYKKLDEVSPVDFDCGKLCGAACCGTAQNDYETNQLGLYLMPGEELMYENSDDFELYCINSDDEDYFQDGLYLVACKNPPHCNREIRPIQCRTFPLIPHISEDGLFHLILDENEFPYECPIIRDKIKLNDDFIEVNFMVWKKLINNPLVNDLIESDSRIRDNEGDEYEIII